MGLRHVGYGIPTELFGPRPAVGGTWAGDSVLQTSPAQPKANRPLTFLVSFWVPILGATKPKRDGRIASAPLPPPSDGQAKSQPPGLQARAPPHLPSWLLLLLVESHHGCPTYQQKRTAFCMGSKHAFLDSHRAVKHDLHHFPRLLKRHVTFALHSRRLCRLLQNHSTLVQVLLGSSQPMSARGLVPPLL